MRSLEGAMSRPPSPQNVQFLFMLGIIVFKEPPDDITLLGSAQSLLDELISYDSTHAPAT